jgi:hypothetical protein
VRQAPHHPRAHSTEEEAHVTSVLAAELDLENLLLRIPHVLGARVRVRPGGSVERIHILANRAARAEQLAFEIERAVEEQRALRLDPGVVSVAALDDEEAERAAAPQRLPVPSRIELRRLTFEPADPLRVRVAAELRLHDIVFRGEVCEADVPRARPALAGRAVLSALEFLRERGVAFYLEGIDFLEGFHAPVALAALQARLGGAGRALTGCALVADSRDEAAARATLAAINRFYGSIPPGAGP